MQSCEQSLSTRLGCWLAVVVALTSVGAAGVSAQDADAKPCEAPEFRQFDFWIGDWDLKSRSLSDPETDTWEESTARNTVRADYEGCVIMERFEGAPATPLRGTSVSSYNAARGLWQQTWVDNYGVYMTFEGQMDDSARMILSRSVVRDTLTIHQRMVFANMARDSLDWYWERSTDGGKSWKLLWHLHYTRRP